MDDGFSIDLGQQSALPPFRYKPDFVSPIAARYAPNVAKPSYISAIDARGIRAYQGQTAAALAGECHGCGLGHGSVVHDPSRANRRSFLKYRMDSTSPLYARYAPSSQKPDFVSPLDDRYTRFMQTRVAASLASMFDQFDPNTQIPTADDLKSQSLPEDNTDGSATIIDDIAETTTPPPSQGTCEETAFKNADCTYKKLPLIGGAIAGIVVIRLLMG